MAYDQHTVEYCLTKDGWILSDRRSDDVVCIEIWEKETYQGSGFGKESSTWRRVWANPNFSQQEIDGLHEQFPKPDKAKITDEALRNLMSSLEPGKKTR